MKNYSALVKIEGLELASISVEATNVRSACKKINTYFTDEKIKERILENYNQSFLDTLSFDANLHIEFSGKEYFGKVYKVARN